MIIYLASYLPCIYEGNWMTLSLHRTKKGAEMSVEFHKDIKRKEHKDHEKWCKETKMPCIIKFGDWEKWGVFEKPLNK